MIAGPMNDRDHGHVAGIGGPAHAPERAVAARLGSQLSGPVAVRFPAETDLDALRAIAGVSGTVLMDQFWQFFLVWGVIVVIGAGGVGSVLTATVGNRWFVARRGLALGRQEMESAIVSGGIDAIRPNDLL